MRDDHKENLNPDLPEEEAAPAAPDADAGKETDASPKTADDRELNDQKADGQEDGVEEDGLEDDGETVQPPEPEKKKKQRLSNWLHSTKFKHGSMSTVFIVGVLVLAVLLNVGAGALVNRFPSLRLDMTADRRLSISSDFGDLIDSIDSPTEVIFCAPHDTIETTYNSTLQQYVGGDAATEGTRLLELVSKAAERNKNITVSFVDIESNPGFVKDYADDSLVSSSIIVKSSKRYKILGLSDLYKQSQDSSGKTIYASNIEYTIGNAMLAVNVEKLPVVGVVSGHGELEPTTLTSLLKSNNFEIQTVDLMLTQPIDASIDVLIINAPTGDYTKDQVKILDDFLSNDNQYGKNVVVALHPNQPALPNFSAFLADWGIEVAEPGSIVMETDNSHYTNNPLFPLLKFGEDTIFQEYANKVAIGYAVTPFNVLWESHSGVSVDTLLSTYDSAYSVSAEKIADYVPTDDDKRSFPVLTMSSKGMSGTKVIYSRVVTLGSTEMFNSFTSYSSAANSDCALALFRFLSGTTGDEDKVYIAPTTLTSTDFTVSNSLVTTVGLIIFTITIPLLVLVAGFVVWLRRRHL